MTSLYKKNELLFSLPWILLYVVLFSLADKISALLGIQKIITAPLCVLFSGFLWVWMKKQGLTEKYGLCRVKGKAKEYFYFIPLLLLASCNLWNGACVNLPAVETSLFILSMLCVGFIEEIIFRGFLFKALCKENIKSAVLVSSVTFGSGHVVNLLNGAEVLSTLLQLCYACAIGFLFVVLFQKSGSLLPCILTHSVVNSLSAFSVPGSRLFEILTAILLTGVPVGYALFLQRSGSFTRR